jgi:hypothetical protein
MLKYLATFFAVLLIFLAAFILAERQFSPFFQSCLSHESEGQQTGKQGDGSFGAVIIPYARCTSRFVGAHGVAITALASLVIAAFTGTLWIATSRQGQLTLNSLELARKEFISTHRPRVIVRFIQGPMNDANGNEFVSVTIVNVGGSPATIDAVGADRARRNSRGEWAPPGLNATPKNIHPVSLISGQRHTFNVTAKTPSADPETAADTLNGHELCVVGAVNYMDGNRVSRETGFFRIYDESRSAYPSIAGISLHGREPPQWARARNRFAIARFAGWHSRGRGDWPLFCAHLQPAA